MFTSWSPPPVVIVAVALAAGTALAMVEPVAGWLAAGLLLVLGLLGAGRRGPATPRSRRGVSWLPVSWSWCRPWWSLSGPSSRSGPLPPPPPERPSSLHLSPRRWELLESAVVHALDAVVILEAEPKAGPGRAVLYVNDAFCRLTGYQPDEVVGRSLHFLRGPGSDETALAVVREALDAGRPLRTELLNYRKDGSSYWVDLSLVPVAGDAGTVTHWVMIQRDITDRKRAEDELRRRESLLRGIFESTSAGIAVCDARERVRYCNPAYAAMLGRPVEEVLRLPVCEFIHADDWPTLTRFMSEAWAGDRNRFEVPVRYVRPDGSLVWCELSTAIVRGPDGRPEAGVSVVIDVTGRKKLEEQLRQAQKMEALGQMAGGIAHDFNNLLTAVLCNLGQIRLPEGDPNRAHLAVIEQAAARAADLTSKLLGYARRSQLVLDAVDPRAAFAEVLGLVRPALDPRVTVTVSVAEGCDAVWADPTLLTQVLLNLCLNARDAMPGGGRLMLSAEPVTVGEEEVAGRSGPARPGRFVRLSVADTGCGMPPEVQARVFEPFFTTKGVGKGSGLGLAMVQGIVQQHGGWVTFESAPGQGTRFDVYLPAAPPGPPRPPSEVLRMPAPRPTTTPSPEPAPAPAATVLLVDDEPMILDIGRAVLEQAGFRVVTAADGAEAVETFRQDPGGYDLVILDVTMPRLSGRDAYRQMIELNPQVRVLFSTGYSSEELVELDGTRGLLSKPYRPHELVAAVRAALAGSAVPPVNWDRNSRVVPR